ncbi:MAG: TetR family transcriptional regulator [Ilumatobacteraceae bacterium]
MEPTTAEVKPRSYDSSRRHRTAQATRVRIVAAARKRFLSDGYATSTIATIAGDADVSVDTVFKAFGGKPGLLRAIHSQSLAGVEPVGAEARSDALQTTEGDPDVIMRGLGRLTAEVAPLVAPLMLLIRDAALTDPEVAGLKTQLDQQRLDRMTHNARTLAAAGHLRPDITIEHAAEVMWTYSAPEFFELLVIRRGWTSEQLGDFVGDALAAHLLPRPRSRRRSAGRQAM